MNQNIPPIILKNPPHEIYAYILGRPNNMLMGVAVDTHTGRNLEAVILPTKQRVMLALGIGDDTAQAHHKYRQATNNNYTLTWTDDPESEEALQRMSEKLKRVSRGVQKAIREPTPSPKQEPEPAKTEEPTHAEETSEDITRELVSGKKSVEGFF